ncbi:MAG TPA: PilC/PilY family type IV pilus protein, partial [Methylophilaceae bacterium]|nr:PilC/PilY family type IV pilus protein [Methylophilaceae bacterium]
YLYPDATYKHGRTSGSPDQQVTKSMLSNVLKVSGAPYYYSVIPTEYCKAVDLRECTLSSVATGAYIFPARSRWCDSTALTSCQSIKAGNYVWPRYVGVGATTAVAAAGSFKVTGANKNQNATVTSIKVNGVEVMGGTGTGCGAASSNSSSNTASTRYNALATQIIAKINSCTSSPEYTAVIDGSDNTKILITSTTTAGASANGTITGGGYSNGAAIGSTVAAARGVTGVTAVPPYTFTRTDIVSTTTSYPKAAARADCGLATDTTCTYAEEITNFGNWYAYYRTRMQAMKSAASLAFKPIDNRYRVGFVTISSQSSNYLPIDIFDAGAGKQKDKWYTKLFGISPSSSTPLRSALATVGRIYAGKKPIGSSDPVQYSCQQNFALLTTDGYWNSDSASDVKDISGSGSVGNKDGGSTPRPMYEGPTASSNSLADVANYYYDTDLRDSGLSNCTGALGAGVDVCKNNVFVSGTDNNEQQHMTTFTLGLGVDGTLMYTSDYKNIKKDVPGATPPVVYPAQTGAGKDYYQLINGYGTPTMNWPVAVQDTETAVDDLWHAAVNGQGIYFSAKDPAQLTQGLVDALSQINAKIGAGAAAATSTLNPVAGNNFAYVASYTTVKWTGNLESRSIDVNTGAVSATANWCAEDVLPPSCSGTDKSVVLDSSGASPKYYCVTATAGSCTAPDVWGDGTTVPTTSCKKEIAATCTGKMSLKVSAGADTRSIKFNNGGTLDDFLYGSLPTAQQAYFDSTKQASLSQWSSLDATQKSHATGENLVNYLRGQTGYEDIRSANLPKNKIYRYREALLGDALESAPAFIAKPTFSYIDEGYSEFKTAQVDREGTVYLGTNDGMLHAFDAATGNERWAYVPTMSMSNMWKLADKNYATLHTNYVNGDSTIGDICVANCSLPSAEWKTILVGGLSGGGRGYHALDITNPNSPVLLWEFTVNNDSDVGYSFGVPVITKKTDGTWVVLLTSGYNNVSPGTGKGYLFVLDANSGSVISKIGTGSGNTTTPSGLARVRAFLDEPEKNNTALYVYGGDLLGQLWRFDINAETAMLFAKLEAGGVAQPITTIPELGKINEKRVVFVGTGKYLEQSDLTNTDVQTLYAIKDDNETTTFDNPRDSALMVEQEITNSGANMRRVTNPSVVNFVTGRGWFIDLPDPGPGSERQNIAARLVQGTLIVPTNVPVNSVCTPGGYGYLNFLDYRTGAAVEGTLVSSKQNAMIVGVNVVFIEDDHGRIRPVVTVVTSDNPTPELVPDVKFAGNAAGFTGTRAIWRELPSE